MSDVAAPRLFVCTIALALLAGCLGDVDFDSIEPQCVLPRFDVASRDAFCAAQAVDLAPIAHGADLVVAASNDPSRQTAALLTATSGPPLVLDDAQQTPALNLLARLDLHTLRAGEPLALPTPDVAQLNLDTLPRADAHHLLRLPPADAQLLDSRGDLLWLNYGFASVLAQRDGDTLRPLENGTLLPNRALLPTPWAASVQGPIANLRVATRTRGANGLTVYISSLVHMRALNLSWDPQSRAWTLDPQPIPTSYAPAADAICDYQCLEATFPFPLWREGFVDPDDAVALGCDCYNPEASCADACDDNDACASSCADCHSSCPTQPGAARSSCLASCNQAHCSPECRQLPDCGICAIIALCSVCDCAVSNDAACPEGCAGVASLCTLYRAYPTPAGCGDLAGASPDDAFDRCLAPSNTDACPLDSGCSNALSGCIDACKAPLASGASPNVAFPLFDATMSGGLFGYDLAALGGLAVRQAPGQPDRLFIGSNGAIYQVDADDLDPVSFANTLDALNPNYDWPEAPTDIYSLSDADLAPFRAYFRFSNRAFDSGVAPPPDAISIKRVALPNIEGQPSDALVALDLHVQDDALYALVIRVEAFEVGANSDDTNLFFLVAYPLNPDGSIQTDADTSATVRALAFDNAYLDLNVFSSRVFQVGSGLLGLNLVSVDPNTSQTRGLMRVFDTQDPAGLVELPARPLASADDLSSGDLARSLDAIGILSSSFSPPVATPVLSDGDTHTFLLPSGLSVEAFQLTVGGDPLDP